MLGAAWLLPSEAALAENTLIGPEAIAEGEQLESDARRKIATLEALMGLASARGIDVKREETLLWFSNSFLTFADWDEENADGIRSAFGYYEPYSEDADQWARELPNFERRDVITMLDDGIATLGQVLAGEIDRPAARPVEWSNIEVGDNALYHHDGTPVFLYDYFSKTVGQPLTNTDIYNDHLGAIFHGGENLYPVDHDRAVNPFVLREDGSLDPELWAEVTDIDQSNVGFLILWNMGVPDWVKEREPQVEMGRSLFTGFDIDNPLMRDVWGTILHRTAEVMRGRRTIQLGYIFSNEPHWFSESPHWTAQFREMNEISTYTRDGFRRWLDEKYAGNIAALNANWGTSFASFGTVEIGIPIPSTERGTPRWFDWSRYNMDRVIDWFTHLQTELHSVDPDADTHIKIMPHMFTHNARSHGIDIEQLTELTTMIGDDAQASPVVPQRGNRDTSWTEHYAYYWHELALGYDFLESVSPDKIHVNSESHFLSASWFRQLDMSPAYVRNVYWLATLLGMDANMGWFWARDPDGSPEDRLEGELNFFDPALAGSYAASVNMQPRVANETTQVMHDLNSVSEEIIALREQRRPLRLFYSETSAINKPNHMTELEHLFEELFFDGFPLGFATQRIIERQDNALWDTVLVHKTQYATDAEVAALQSYLDGGGTVVLHGADNLTMNEYGQRRTAPALSGSRGRLIEMAGDTSLADVRKRTLALFADSLPDVTLSQRNADGEAVQSIHWRAVRQDNGSMLVNAFNLGRGPVTFDLGLATGRIGTVRNLMTGETLATQQTIAPMDVLLLEISPGS